MRKILGFLLATSLTKFAVANAPKTTEDLDIDRYQGLWHQIAFIPNSFQEKCTGSVTAQYKLTQQGRLQVINRCLNKMSIAVIHANLFLCK